MLGDVTPLLITLDERPNIERTLATLDWARRIVVIDSGSTDGTREWLQRQSRVALFTRPFDGFAPQCEFGLRETGIETEWVLSLDADHALTPELTAEIALLEPTAEISGFEARFRYCIAGRRLRDSLYPPRIVLARRAKMRFEPDGHAHRIVVEGEVGRLASAILHDDRKPRSRWLAEQVRYAAAEADKISATPFAALSFQDRLRRLAFVAPWLVPLYCLTVKQGLLSGRAGWVYAGERAVAEWLLSMAIVGKGRKGKNGA